MVKISVLYPDKSGSRFDFDYYVYRHMPLSIDRLGPALRGITVDQGIKGASPQLQTPYVAMSQFLFDSFEAFLTAFTPHAAELTKDMANYTDITPVIQLSDVRIYRF